MGIKSKHTSDQISKAVQRYVQGDQVTVLAKEYKVSVPGMYLWIAKARDEAAEQVRRQAMSPGTVEIDKKVNVELQLKAVMVDNDRLRRKLLDLMIKSGELEL